MTKQEDRVATLGRRSPVQPWQVSRAEGCLLGQICGDALGSRVDYYDDAEAIRRDFPNGVRDMCEGGVFNTLAGQPTDDSEMALALARTLISDKRFDLENIRAAYLDWFESGPFDCGETVAAALCGSPNQSSQGNGALMRACPIGLFGASLNLETVAEWARQDAAITHPHPICQETNALFVMLIATALIESAEPAALYKMIVQWAEEMKVSEDLRDAISIAETESWIDRSSSKKAWVLVAFQNAIWQLLHAPNLEEGVVDTIRRGGATGTNAAVAGALLGVVYGREAIPTRWDAAVCSCKPESGAEGVCQPRPQHYWPCDAADLARRLLCS